VTFKYHRCNWCCVYFS